MNRHKLFIYNVLRLFVAAFPVLAGCALDPSLLAGNESSTEPDGDPSPDPLPADTSVVAVQFVNETAAAVET
ncbi:MAG: hypothetical protein JSV19_02845, partial [Phycisphaerales bacterium]